MPEPASGSRVIIGFARESRWGEPGIEPLIYHRPVLPFSADFVRPESATGETSTAGWKLPGLPGPVTGPVDFGVSFTAGGSPDLFEHVLRGATRNELEAGVAFQYDFEQDASAPETSLRILYAYPPADRAHVYGVKFSSITQQIANNAPIQSRMAGQAGHGTRVGAAAAAAGNLGTWTGRPWLRGVMADPAAGDVHVRVVRDVAGGGLRYRVEVSTAAPTFAAGADNDVVYGADGRARWLNLQDQNGRDVGIWDAKGNRDPVEILLPGTAADHALISIGDTWTFKAPLTWTDPVPTYLAGQRYTSAHWFVDYRAQGAAAWNELAVDGGNATVAIGWPVSLAPGNASKYPTALDRDQDSAITVQLPRKLRDLFFQGSLERHDRFELRLRWLGQQLGSAAQWRESVAYEFPSVALTAAARPASAPTAIIETLDLAAEGGPAGEPPIRVSVITSRDWTPFAAL